MESSYDELEEALQQKEQDVLDVQGIISGMIGSLRMDIFTSKRTKANADEIIGYLTTIDEKLDRI